MAALGEYRRWRVLRRRGAIVGMCATVGITRVVLFGSTARGTAGRHSDVDLAVAPCGPFEFAHLPHLQSDLAHLLRRPVQLEPYALLPRYYQIGVDQDGIVLTDLSDTQGSRRN